MKAITITKLIGDSTFEFLRNEGEDYDTKVKINGKLLCWISFSELNEFVDSLNQVVDKFRI